MVLSNKEWLDKMNEIISAIKNGGGDSQVIEDMLSNMWISSATYNVGDYVLYNNNIWKCLVQNSNITPSEGTTWTRVNITSEISTLNSNLNNLIYTKDVQIYFNPGSSRGLWEFNIDSTKFLNAYVVNQGSTEVELSFRSYDSGIYISSSITGQELTVRFVLYK